MPGLITRPGTPGTADQKRVVNTKVVKRILGENAYRESANKAWKEANSAKGSDVLERCRQLNAYLSKEFLTGTHGSETDSDSDSDISKGSSATDSDIELDEEPLTSPKPARPKPAVKAARRRCAALRRAQHAQQGRCSTSGSSRSDGSSRHGHSKRGSRPGTSSGISARDLGSVRIRCVSELGLAQSSQLKDSLGLLESVVSPAAFDALCRAHQRAEDIQDSERLQHVLLNDRVHQLTAWGQLSRPGSAQAPSHRMTVASS
ncbi:hypothetical protein WJX72_006311 [[Myrmecia] bisecta]|uniref:Uncharacterized protein n=1 Tax=[Myrmecia] bisecta TaxID=41462 RepID=A0AAW1PYK6_9CHLO